MGAAHYSVLWRMTRPSDLQPVPGGRWPGGVNNVDDVHELGNKFARWSENFDFDRQGKIKRRQGYTLMISGFCHSIFGDDTIPFGVAVKDGHLGIFDLGGVTFNPIVAVDRAAFMSYTYFNDEIYFSNGISNGIMDRKGRIRSWGIDTPGQVGASGQGLAAAPEFYEPANLQYLVQVATTFMNTRGEESGAGLAANVLVSRKDGLILTNLPQSDDNSVAVGRIYASQPNGDVLYHVSDYAMGTDTLPITVNNTIPGKVLQTQFMDRVPCGTIVRSYKGRIYIASGNTLYYTDPLRFGLYSIKDNYFRYPSEILMVESVEDGIYVGTRDKVWFLSGKDPVSFEQRVVDLFGVVPYSSGSMRGAVFGKDAYQQPVVIWWSVNGNIIKGQVEGVTVPLTEGRLSLPRYQKGAIMYREQDGNKQIVSSMRGPDHEKFGAKDFAVARVFRNGVEI